MLVSRANLRTCPLLYCKWCDAFIAKSTYENTNSISNNNNNAEHENEAESIDLACTKCHRYLIRNGRLNSASTELDSTAEPNAINQTNQHKSIDILREQSSANAIMRPQSVQSFQHGTPSSQLSQSALDTAAHLSTSNGDSSRRVGGESGAAPTTNDERIQQVIANNQLSKKSLDEAAQQSKKIANNLKLFITICVLNQHGMPRISSVSANSPLLIASIATSSSLTSSSFTSPSSSVMSRKSDSRRIQRKAQAAARNSFGSRDSTTDMDGAGVDGGNGLGGDEQLVSIFHVANFFAYEFDTRIDRWLSLQVENGLCVLTTRRIISFRILKRELFEQDVDVERCLRKEYSIRINIVEIIETSLGQHYLMLESVGGGSHSVGGSVGVAEVNDETARRYFKIITLDAHQTQTFLSILLSMCTGNSQKCTAILLLLLL